MQMGGEAARAPALQSILQELRCLAMRWPIRTGLTEPNMSMPNDMHDDTRDRNDMHDHHSGRSSWITLDG